MLFSVTEFGGHLLQQPQETHNSSSRFPPERTLAQDFGLNVFTKENWLGIDTDTLP